MGKVIKFFTDGIEWLKRQGFRVKLIFFAFLGAVFLICISVLFYYIGRIAEDVPRTLSYVVLTLGSLVIIYLFGYVHGSTDEAKRNFDEIEAVRRERDAYKLQIANLAQFDKKMSGFEKDMKRKRELMKQVQKELKGVRAREQKEEFEKRISAITNGISDFADDMTQPLRELLEEIKTTVKGGNDKKKSKWPPKFKFPFSKN